MRSFLLNFWSQTCTCSASNEDDLRERAQAIATERRTIVSFHEVIDGRAHCLGAVGPEGHAPRQPRRRERKPEFITFVE